MTNLVSVHLKDFDGQESIVFHPVINLDIGADGVPLGVYFVCLVDGHFAAPKGYLHSTEITNQRTCLSG